MKLVYVEWVDSSSSIGVWNREQDLLANDALLKCKSVGWLVKNTASAVVIAAHIANSSQFGGDMAIPRKAITRIDILPSPKNASFE